MNEIDLIQDQGEHGPRMLGGGMHGKQLGVSYPQSHGCVQKAVYTSFDTGLRE